MLVLNESLSISLQNLNDFHGIRNRFGAVEIESRTNTWHDKKETHCGWYITERINLNGREISHPDYFLKLKRK